MKVRLLKYVVVSLAAITLVSLLYSGDPSPTQNAPVTMVDPNNLHTAYLKWKAAALRAGADRALVLPLGYSKGLSARFMRGRGQATLDLVHGSISVRISGLADDAAHDVWLVDNRPGPGHSVRPEAGDAMHRLGRLQRSGATASLDAPLHPDLLASFRLDQVVVTPAGESPATAGLLYGSPSLFQRLFYAEQRERPGSAAAVARGTLERSLAAPFSALVPAPAFAQEIVALSPELASFAGLVARGERLFFAETFRGNGRTCGSCHPAENNFTIDPKFIATRPKTDPLFVAEFVPALKELEKPKLMREFGLILENVDGLDDPTHKFAMRGVPHTLALPNSLQQPTNLAGAPAEMTGWSGDGSPGGTLRDFATGAVTQHFTRSLDRVPGVDFRLPTPEELDAMEAFQLALGRQADLDLTTLVLANPVAAAGQEIFQNGTNGGDVTLPGGKCSACHRNAGALNTPNGENRNFNTGAEDRPNSPTALTPGIPRDGGFGVAPNTGGGGFGDGRFNSTPLVEAADTGPFFHNDSARTLEEAVAHYTTDAFNNNPFNPRAVTAQIAMTEDQIKAVAAFLRVINAVENDRSAIQYAQLATRAVQLQQAQRPLSLAVAELTDALQVLAEQSLHPDAAEYLQRARRLLEQARITSAQLQRNFLIRSAINAASQARGLMVTSG